MHLQTWDFIVIYKEILCLLANIQTREQIVPDNTGMDGLGQKFFLWCISHTDTTKPSILDIQWSHKKIK